MTPTPVTMLTPTPAPASFPLPPPLTAISGALAFPSPAEIDSEGGEEGGEDGAKTAYADQMVSSGGHSALTREA